MQRTARKLSGEVRYSKSGPEPTGSESRVPQMQQDAASVTTDDIHSRNLVLFGDPATNSLIAKVAPKLPVKWTAQVIDLGGQIFDAKLHTLVMIYPNPLNQAKYVVLNSGHTMGQKEFMGTNALLYPRLGDYAVIENATGAVKLAGLFDESWRVR